ncbi:MAG: thioredoxin domain-containing protein, partial [Chloroflexi bacterium]|nr:thioredoxin domain-containing protein [Chloroflexota bacterium]
FEKMLYDNAQLASLYLAAYQHTGAAHYRRIAEETLDYVRREMTGPEGGFYSSEDADSEWEEGKFYVWTPEELAAALGQEDAAVVARYYGVTAQGNFEGKNVLCIPRSLEEVAAELDMAPQEAQAVVERSRARLLAARGQRVRPGRDQKVLTAWNGLMLRAFAAAAAVLERPDYRATAQRNAAFLLETMEQDGRLRRSYKDGQARFNGYLEDYAFLASGLLALYETDFDLRWLEAARRLADTMLASFWDAREQVFFDTSADHEVLVARPKNLFDHAIPSGNAVALDVLLRLAVLTGESVYADRAVAALQLRRDFLAEHPGGFGRWLCALDFHLGPVQEVAIVGDPDAPDSRELLQVVRRAYRPNAVLALRHPEDTRSGARVPLLADRGLLEGRATAYVCEHYACQQPVNDPAALAAQLARI